MGGGGGLACEPLHRLRSLQLPLKERARVVIILIREGGFRPLRDCFDGKYSVVVNFRELVVELVVVRNYYAVDCKLVVFLVQPRAILRQLLVGRLLPSSGQVAF